MALATSSLAIRTDVVDQVDRVLGLLQPIAEEPDEWEWCASTRRRTSGSRTPPEPTAGPGDLLIRVRNCSICGTDAKIWPSDHLN